MEEQTRCPITVLRLTGPRLECYHPLLQLQRTFQKIHPWTVPLLLNKLSFSSLIFKKVDKTLPKRGVPLLVPFNTKQHLSANLPGKERLPELAEKRRAVDQTYVCDQP